MFSPHRYTALFIHLLEEGHVDVERGAGRRAVLEGIVVQQLDELADDGRDHAVGAMTLCEGKRTEH